MSNKKFISYFHMLYTGLKGTAGAYMAALLVLLSAFAATGAEKTPTTDANRQALPMKAAVKKKSEITKKPPVDTKKTLSSPSDLKVANIVILNNTGLPDKDIYFNLINTATVDSSGNPNKYCPPSNDWDTLFQSYGGTVTPPTPATQIGLNQPTSPPSLVLSYNAQKPDGTGYSSVTLADMRGSVLSNATSTSQTPTSSNSYWNGAKYSTLVPNNPDKDRVGTFPTISMGLFGACNNNEIIVGEKLFAGRIAISAFEPFIGDNFDNSPTPAKVPPYVLIEGSIFPTDNTAPKTPLGYPSQASNLDLSFVDQISIAANIELWAPESQNGPFVPNPKGWLAGYSLSTLKDTISYFQKYNNNPIDGIGIQSRLYEDPQNINNTYDLFYAFTHPMVPIPLSPYTGFVNALISNGSSGSGTNGNQVLKVAGNANLGMKALLEFGDCSYGYLLDYKFFTYFVDMSPTTKVSWSQILGWYVKDSGSTIAPLSVADPTQFLSYTNSVQTKNITDYMLMLGTFLPGPDWNLSTNPFNVPGGPGSGPISIQLSTNNLTSQIDICRSVQEGASIQVPCLSPEIQSAGFNSPSQPTGGIFGNSVNSTVNGPLGINFTAKSPSYRLEEFDLSIGKTETGPGTLQVDLVNVSKVSSTNLVRVSINIPITPNEGLASAVVVDPLHKPSIFTTGFSVADNNLSLQIDWINLKCTYHGNQLTTATFSYWDKVKSQWMTPTGANSVEYIAACTLTENTSPSSSFPYYRLNIQGENLTVALTSSVPSSPAETQISPGYPPNFKQNYTIGAIDYPQILDQGNISLLNQIKIAPAPTPATTLLHLLAVSKADLLLPTGLAGNSPKYRFLRWNTTKTPAIWEEAFGKGPTDGSSDPYWPIFPGATGGSNGTCAPASFVGSTVAPAQKANALPGTTSTLLNNISGRCLGDVCTAFTYGMVNSIKLGSAFPASDVSWPVPPFPPFTTYIGALTTAQYFQLLGSQKQNNGKLPAGANNRTLNNILRYDPYNDLGVNQAQSNCYFSGFSDRFGSSGFGGIFNPNPTFLMDLTTANNNKLSLGNVPGTINNNTVIVITLHPIPTHPTITTIMHDVNQSGSTDSVDLSLVLLAIGVCPPAPETCPEDVNKDGVVDNTDVGLVLLHFGL